jgi:5-methylcytosine-specific restriction endonuclease McrA
MEQTRICRDCYEEKPLTREFFNEYNPGKWRPDCKTCRAARTKKHYYLNPQKAKDRVSRYNQQKARAEGFMTDLEKASVRRLFGDRCFFCGTDLEGGGEWDHNIPISAGGTNWPNNMLLVCRTCNRDKHAKTGEEYVVWMRERGLALRFDTEDFPYRSDTED